MAEQYTDIEKKEILAILNKDRGKCPYCHRPLSIFDSIAGGVCERCVKKHHKEAMGIY